MIRFI